MLFPSLLFLSATLALQTNRTVDDEHGDEESGALPAYSPSTDVWSQGARCAVCGVNMGNVDLGQVHDGTWHDGTYRPGSDPLGITVSFSGIAVYVFNIVANNLLPTITFTNISFYLDEEYVGQYSHAPDDSSTLQYNVLVFHRTDLTNAPHTLLMSASGADISLILFDYLVYTVDDSLPLPASSSNVGTSATSPSGSVPPTLSKTTTSTASESLSLTSRSDGMQTSTSSGDGSTLPHSTIATQPTSLSTSSASAPPTSIASPSRSALSAGTIAGITLACVGLLVLTGVAIWLRRRLRKHDVQRIGPSSVRGLRNEDFDGFPEAASGPDPTLRAYTGLRPQPSETMAMLGYSSRTFATLDASVYDHESSDRTLVMRSDSNPDSMSDRTLVMRDSTSAGRKRHYHTRSASRTRTLPSPSGLRS